MSDFFDTEQQQKDTVYSHLLVFFFLGKDTLTEKIVEIHRLIHSLPPINLEALELLMKHLYK